MKKVSNSKNHQKGLGLIGVLLIIGVLVITAGGVVWEKKAKPSPTPIPSPTPAKQPLTPTTNLKIEQNIYTQLRQKGKVLIIVSLKSSTKPVIPETEEERFQKGEHNLEKNKSCDLFLPFFRNCWCIAIK